MCIRYRSISCKSLIEIPCYVRELDEEEAITCSIIENLERANLTPMEEARAFQTKLKWKVSCNCKEERQEGMDKKLRNDV